MITNLCKNINKGIHSIRNRFRLQLVTGSNINRLDKSNHGCDSMEQTSSDTLFEKVVEMADVNLTKITM